METGCSSLVRHEKAFGRGPYTILEHPPKFQDIDLAIKAASKAVEFGDQKNASANMDTLARCGFVNGDRAKAVA